MAERFVDSFAVPTVFPVSLAVHPPEGVFEVVASAEVPLGALFLFLFLPRSLTLSMRTSSGGKRPMWF